MRQKLGETNWLPSWLKKSKKDHSITKSDDVSTASTEVERGQLQYIKKINQQRENRSWDQRIEVVLN